MDNSNNRMPGEIAVPAVLCSACNSPISSSANFCPACGKKLRATPLSTSVLKQSLVYLVSFFLAPFGLFYAWKYLRQPDRKSKAIGSVAVVLTFLSLAISFWVTAELFDSIIQLLRSLGSMNV